MAIPNVSSSDSMTRVSTTPATEAGTPVTTPVNVTGHFEGTPIVPTRTPQAQRRNLLQRQIQNEEAAGEARFNTIVRAVPPNTHGFSPAPQTPQERQQ